LSLAVWVCERAKEVCWQRKTFKHLVQYVVLTSFTLFLRPTPGPTTPLPRVTTAVVGVATPCFCCPLARPQRNGYPSFRSSEWQQHHRKWANTGTDRWRTRAGANNTLLLAAAVGIKTPCCPCCVHIVMGVETPCSCCHRPQRRSKAHQTPKIRRVETTPL
jgi:hypothetical protein